MTTSSTEGKKKEKIGLGDLLALRDCLAWNNKNKFDLEDFEQAVERRDMLIAVKEVLNSMRVEIRKPLFDKLYELYGKK